MARKEDSTPLNKGVGSVSADFTAPQVRVATPGRNQTAQPTEAERFRDAMFTFGRGVVGAAQGRAQINNELKVLKERSYNKVERELNRHSAAFQNQRLRKADEVRRQIIEDSEWRGPEWGERELRTRMNNAPSQEESGVYEGSWKRAYASIDRTNKEEYRQKFNSAKMSVSKGGLALVAQMNEDPALKATLIGDGTNIGRRVQDWALSEMAAAADLDSLEEADAEVLTHNIITWSANLTEKLRKGHVLEIEKSNTFNGGRQLEADTLSTVLGDQTVGDLEAQISVTLTEKLSHLSPEQQVETVRKHIRSTISNMAGGRYGIDAGGDIDRIKDLASMEIDGGLVFAPAEQEAMLNAALQSGQKTVDNTAQAAIVRLQEATRIPVATGDGVIHQRGNLGALLDRDQQGFDSYDREEARVIRELNLTSENPSTEEILLRQTVRDRFEAARQSQARLHLKDNGDQQVYGGYFTGQRTGPGGANKAYKHDPFSRFRMSGTELANLELLPVGVDEIAGMRQHVEQFIPEGSEALAKLDSWDGQPLEFNEDNAELNMYFARAEAAQYNLPGVVAANGFPSERSTLFMSRLQSNNEHEVAAAVEFLTMLAPGAGGSLDSLIDQASSAAPNAEAAIMWARTNSRLGQMGSDDPVARASIGNGVQTILNSPDISTWLTADRVTDEDTVSQGLAIATSLAAVFQENGEITLSDEAGTADQINQMIMSNTNGLGRNWRVLAAAGMALDQGMTPATIAAQLYAAVRKDGYRPRSIGGKMHLVQDPNGYIGGEDYANVEELVAGNMTAPFNTAYRSFLQEAMGLSGQQTPTNLMEMGMLSNDVLADLVDPTNRPGAGQLQARWDSQYKSKMRMLETPQGYGGAIVEFTMNNGVILEPTVSTNDAYLTLPTGDQVFVPAGTVLNVINPLLFGDSTEFVPRRYNVGPAVEDIDISGGRPSGY